MHEIEIQLVGERLLVTLYQNKCKKLKQRTQFYVQTLYYQTDAQIYNS